jgi:rhodanese-related sulfurtransferase
MKISRRRRNLFGSGGVFLICWYVCLALLPIFSNAQSSGVRHLFPLQTQVEAGNAALPDPLFPFESLVDTKFLDRSPVKETLGCKTLEVWQSVAIRPEQWNSIIGTMPAGFSEVGVLAIQDSANCVKPGQPFRAVFFNVVSGISVELGWFFPTAIHRRRAKEINIARIENQLLLGARLPLDSQDVVFVSGRVIASHQRIWGPRMQGVRFINRQQIESVIKLGIKVVDIRPRGSFDIFRIKNSINVPYHTGPRMNFHEGYASYSKAGDAFDIRKIPPNKYTPIVLVGNYDTANVFRAAVVLRGEGWKRIFIFGEGIEYFSGMMWSPPAESRLIRLVSSLEVAQMVADKALRPIIIDVRQDILFAQGHIPGAHSLEFIERSDLRLRIAGLNGKMLREYGEYQKMPEKVNTASTLIFVGVSERDWAPYKAALLAREYGFSNSMWYRGGMSEWSRLAQVNGDVFKVTSQVESASKGIRSKDLNSGAQQ